MLQGESSVSDSNAMDAKPADVIQESRYDFPYHHLVGRDSDGGFHLHRYYHFGLDYWLNMDAVLEVFRQLSPDSLLDVGCGDGRFLKEVNREFPRTTLEGFDPSEQALRFARGFNPELDFFASWSDVTGSYDCVSAVEVLEHIEPKKLPQTLERIRSVLNGDGLFVLTVPSERYETTDKHYQHFSEENLRELLDPYFRPQSIDFTVNPNWTFQVLRRLLVNRFWISNLNGLNKFIWRIAKRYCQKASPEDGKHLLAVCRPD